MMISGNRFYGTNRKLINSQKKRIRGDTRAHPTSYIARYKFVWVRFILFSISSTQITNRTVVRWPASIKSSLYQILNWKRLVTSMATFRVYRNNGSQKKPWKWRLTELYRRVILLNRIFVENIRFEEKINCLTFIYFPFSESLLNVFTDFFFERSSTLSMKKSR